MFSAQADLLRAEYDRSVAAADLARLSANSPHMKNVVAEIAGEFRAECIYEKAKD